MSRDIAQSAVALADLTSRPSIPSGIQPEHKNAPAAERSLLVHERSPFISYPASCLLIYSRLSLADQIPVRYTEGSVHGYLAIRSLDGKIVGSGDLIQTVHGQRVVSRLVYRFKDGSIDDDTAVFTQSGHFRLISDHHIQKGPTFPNPMDVTIKATTGDVTVRYKDKNEDKVETSHMDLPPDLANGILLDVLKNIQPDTAETKMSYLATTPKPRLIKLSVVPAGDEAFVSAGRPSKALRFLIKVEICGLSGIIAPLVGKQPANTTVWIGTGEVPAFIKSEEPLYVGGPVLRTELTSPAWNHP